MTKLHKFNIRKNTENPTNTADKIFPLDKDITKVIKLNNIFPNNTKQSLKTIFTQRGTRKTIVRRA